MSAVSAIMCFEHVSLVPFHNHGYFLLNNLHILPDMDSGCACMHACVCGRAYCYSNKWHVGIVIFFQFQSMQFESGRSSNNGEWLYTPTGCPPPRVYNTHSSISARSVVLKCKLSTPSFILSDAWCLTRSGSG